MLEESKEAKLKRAKAILEKAIVFGYDEADRFFVQMNDDEFLLVKNRHGADGDLLPMREVNRTGKGVTTILNTEPEHSGTLGRKAIGTRSFEGVGR